MLLALASGIEIGKTVGNIERRDSVPSFTALVWIADGLGIRLSDLVRLYEERLDELGDDPARAR